VGLAVDEKAPDHSTLSVFRERLVQRGKWKVFEEMLAEIVRTAMSKGIRFGSIQIVDSVHCLANVNPEKDERRQKRGKPPRDPDAGWGVKHQRKARNAAGKVKEQPEYFYGYKAQVSLDAEKELITAVEVTSGEAYDGHHLVSLVERDLQQGLPMETYAADKEYDNGDNHFYLEQRGLHSAICLKGHVHRRKTPIKTSGWL